MSSPQTSASATTPYVTAAQFFDFFSPQLASDVLRATPDAPRPSYLAMLDPTNPAGAKLLVFLSRGAGEIEAACAIARRYSPLDLQALRGMSQVLLRGLNAARSMWGLYQRLKPGSARPEDCPGAKESESLLRDLRDGQKVFTFEETMDAGLPEVQPANPNRLLTPNVISRAYRLFPGYGLNSVGNYPSGGEQ